MIRRSNLEMPRLDEGISPKLIAMTRERGLNIVMVTDYNCIEEGDIPNWCTACSNAWDIDRSDIIWWAYADDVRELIESLQE